jgi:hypothetical protein
MFFEHAIFGELVYFGGERTPGKELSLSQALYTVRTLSLFFKDVKRNGRPPRRKPRSDLGIVGVLKALRQLFSFPQKEGNRCFYNEDGHYLLPVLQHQTVRTPEA